MDELREEIQKSKTFEEFCSLIDKAIPIIEEYHRLFNEAKESFSGISGEKKVEYLIEKEAFLTSTEIPEEHLKSKTKILGFLASKNLFCKLYSFYLTL